ncbi:hypothetical protein RRF57_001392 [Xylaria bambusicola]|uniref:Uncharacterized protein n=1 Tax=Xylaria bambusicola TaxID=326684 RepID=A0AAN7UHT3_9PEZI
MEQRQQQLGGIENMSHQEERQRVRTTERGGDGVWTLGTSKKHCVTGDFGYDGEWAWSGEEMIPCIVVCPPVGLLWPACHAPVMQRH